MKLWHLRAQPHFVLRRRGGRDPWDPWYDKTFAMVVRAPDENAARRFAAEFCGAEGPEAWLDVRYSTCEELTAETGEPGIIIYHQLSA